MRIDLSTLYSGALLLLTLLPVSAVAQEQATEQPREVTVRVLHEEETVHTRGAWEIGFGAVGTNWSRVTFTNFYKIPGAYKMSLEAKQLLGGPQLYVAREILPWLYLDLQGATGFAPAGEAAGEEGASWKHHQLYMGGLGVQFRLTPLLQSSYVEPYLRLGINYLYRNFQTVYSGKFANDITDQAHWMMEDSWNTGSLTEADKDTSVPASIGLGLKGWLSDSFGVGIQGEYLIPVDGKGPNFAQASLQLIWRIGGKSKKQPAETTYIELPPIERVVEKERIVEKEVPASPSHLAEEQTRVLYELLNAIYFEFDTDDFTQASIKRLDKLATLMEQDPEGRYLIIGMTDARADQGYNIPLSRRRAKAVYDALLSRGVSASRLKWVGVGKGASVVSRNTDHTTREGDRKVLIERILNDKYWDMIK